MTKTLSRPSAPLNRWIIGAMPRSKSFPISTPRVRKPPEILFARRLGSGKPACRAQFQFASRGDLSARDAVVAGEPGVRRWSCQSARGLGPPGRSPAADGQFFQAISRSAQEFGKHHSRSDNRWIARFNEIGLKFENRNPKQIRNRFSC